MNYWGLFNYFFGAILTISVLSAAFKYAKSNQEEDGTFLYKREQWVILALLLAKSIFLTWMQYRVWSASEIGKTLLTSSFEKNSLLPGFFSIFDFRGGYFTFYALTHFWLAFLLALLCAYLWKFFLIFLKNRNSRFLMPGEYRLGFICALASGWPGFVVFLPLAFLMIIPVSVVRLIIGIKYTTIGYPMVLSAVFSIIFQNSLTEFFNLGVLRV